jgi:hypothetical protein
MPTYIYIDPQSGFEKEVVHPMGECKNPSPSTLEAITHEGRVMERKIVPPTLWGFDRLGRSKKTIEEKIP